jgi:uncharacterized protein with HEPN domain
MSKHSDEIVRQDIINAGTLILEFIEGFDKRTFVSDRKTRSAVLYQLTVVGEAVKRLSKEFRKQHTHIPWDLIAGMRDHLIHGYDLIDWDEVWQTAKKDIPDLLQKIEQLSF